MNKFAVGDVLDVSQEFAIYSEAIVEDSFVKKNGSVYYKIRGIKSDGTMGKKTHDLWEDTDGIKKVK